VEDPTQAPWMGGQDDLLVEPTSGYGRNLAAEQLTHQQEMERHYRAMGRAQIALDAYDKQQDLVKRFGTEFVLLTGAEVRTVLLAAFGCPMDELEPGETDVTPAAVVEALADAEHASWARWQEYLFSRCVDRERQHGASVDPDDLVIPGPFVRHWRRQITTPYAELSEVEKESDRKEVRQALAMLDAAGFSIVDKQPA
jgi:hypothetical protein